MSATDVLDEEKPLQELPKEYNFKTKTGGEYMKNFVLYNWYTSGQKPNVVPVVTLHKNNSGIVTKEYKQVSLETEPVCSYLQHPLSAQILLDLNNPSFEGLYYMLIIHELELCQMLCVLNAKSSVYRGVDWSSPKAQATFRKSLSIS
jgi:hypothetical protein